MERSTATSVIHARGKDAGTLSVIKPHFVPVTNGTTSTSKAAMDVSVGCRYDSSTRCPAAWMFRGKSEGGTARGKWQPMRFGARRFLSLCWLLLGVTLATAQQVQLPEYQLKAGFIFNFAKFVEWPADAFPEPQAPIIIGILGKTPFKDQLEQIIRGKTINSRAVTFKEFTAATEATNCHILFVSASEKDRLAEVFHGLDGKPVLTVGETEQFTGSGGMINFIAEGKKIRFEINEESAKRARLKISSKLLTLAARPSR
jgi:hypothetical protein